MKGVFHAKGNIIQFANKGLSTILKMPLKAIIGQSITELFGAENKAHLKKGIEQLCSDKVECKISIKVNSKLPNLEMNLMMLEGAERELLLVGSIQSLVPQEKDRHNLAACCYSTFFDNLSDSIIVYNYVREEIVSVNEALVKVLEYDTKEEMIGLSRFDFIPKKSNHAPGLNLHEYTADHKKRILKGITFNTKGIFIGKNGKEVFSNVKVIPTFYKKGEGMLILQNITNPVNDKKTRKLAENKYRNIFENSHEAIMYLDPTNKLPTICNTNAMHLFGLTTLEDVRNLRLSDFVNEKKIDGVSTHKFYDQLVQQALETGRAESSFWLHKKSGETIRAHAVLVIDKSDEEHPRVICFIRDKTALYKAQLALKEKNKELEKYITSNLQLENFAYFASHDLQAPLNTILSFTSLLQKKLANDDRKDVAEFLKFIVTSGEGMKTLIDDLLAYSLVNTTNLEVKQINLEKQLYVLLHSLDTVIKEKSAVIEVNNIPEQITVDPTKLKQVFQNLITNGIKFVKPGVEPKVVISCMEEKDHWLFSVSDNGIGISQEHQEKIFGLFKRLHSSGEYKGTGIGLAIVKKIIEQHRGTITLVSEKDKGTTFQFTIAKDLATVEHTPKVSYDKMEIGASVTAR